MPAGWAALGGAVLGALGSMASGSPPDNSASIKAASNSLTSVGDTAKSLAEKQTAAMQALVDKYQPLYESQIKSSLDTQAKQSAQSDLDLNTYKQYFQPLQQSLATTAMNYDTAARRETAANDAIANNQTQFDNAGRQLGDQLASAGVDPSSGAAMAQRRQLAGLSAATSAAAGNTARTQVEDRGLNLMSSAAGLGQSIESNGLSAASAATASGNNATSLAKDQTGLAALPGTANASLLGLASSSYGTAGNLQLGLQNAQEKAWSDKDASTKDWIMGGAKVGASALG